MMQHDSLLAKDSNTDLGCRPMPVFPANTLKLDASVVAIGAFDGVHRGHQKVIGSAVQSASRQQCQSVVYTFDIPPKAYFAGARVLTTIDEKVNRISALGASCAVVAKFDRDYAARSAEDFMAELAALNPREIWVGADFRFGARSSGNVDLLSRHFNVKVLDAVRCAKGKVISSTRIRDLLQGEPPADELEVLLPDLGPLGSGVFRLAQVRWAGFTG